MEPTEVIFEVGYDLDIKLSKILRQKLDISSSVFKRLVEQGYIYGENDIDLNKVKLRDKMKIIVLGFKLS